MSIQRRAREPDEQWTGTWAASAQSPEPPIAEPDPTRFEDQTIRQVVRTSIGGRKCRIRLSNELGRSPLAIGAATVATHRAGSSNVLGEIHLLTFSGLRAVTIPAGAPMLSDELDVELPALADLAVSIYLPQQTFATTTHVLGLTTTYVSPTGDHTQAVAMPVSAISTSWYFLTAVDVLTPSGSSAIVAIGDSITDGFGSTVDSNARWPSVLAARLQARSDLRHLAVLNQGIGGNRALFDTFGPGLLSRLDRDLLRVPGAKFAIVLIGTNDIGIPSAFGRLHEEASAVDIISGLKQVIARVRGRDISVIAGTLPPFANATMPRFYTPQGEAKRQVVNEWIRDGNEFDGMVDFDEVLRDPANPATLLSSYDCGDHLHPSNAGYRAMADAFDLSLFHSTRIRSSLSGSALP